MALPDSSMLRVEAIRFTFFSDGPINARGKDWWQLVTGSAPETTQSRQQMGEYSESGPFQDGQFELKVSFNRIDMILGFPFAGLPDSVQIQDYDRRLRDFTALVANWINTSSVNIVRIAFGSVLLFPVSDPIVGNKLVSEYLPSFSYDVNSVTDVFVQMNLPTPSKLVPTLIINELTKIGTLTGQFVQLGVGGFPALTVDHFVRVEFDMSTAADAAVPIDKAIIHDVLSEMIERSGTVLKEGVRS